MSTHLHERENLLPWHAKPWERLMKYVQRGRMPHALFLSGNSGVGKTLLVRQFANTLLCTGSRTKEGLACGRCSACTLFRAGTHPDFSVVAPKQADKGIAIDAIRELSAALALRAQYGGHRVVIISPAHRMTAAAANSLLKTLEEPVERTVIVLISHSPYIMPATILSRCQKIHIDLPSRSVAIQWLRALKITNDADGLLSAAMGAPLLAVELSDNACMARRQTLYETLFMEWATNPVTGESLPAAARRGCGEPRRGPDRAA
ncbi:MAG: DNA polymerase III subunit delta' [Pseudomonadota bacterium]